MIFFTIKLWSCDIQWSEGSACVWFLRIGFMSDTRLQHCSWHVSRAMNCGECKGREWNEKKRDQERQLIFITSAVRHTSASGPICWGEQHPEGENIPKTSPSCLAYSMLFTSRCGSRLSTRSGKYLSVYFLAASLLFFSMYINKRGRRVVHMCGMEGAVDSAGASWMPHSWLTSSVRANVNQ